MKGFETKDLEATAPSKNGALLQSTELENLVLNFIDSTPPKYVEESDDREKWLAQHRLHFLDTKSFKMIDFTLASFLAFTAVQGKTNALKIKPVNLIDTISKTDLFTIEILKVKDVLDFTGKVLYPINAYTELTELKNTWVNIEQDPPRELADFFKFNPNVRQLITTKKWKKPSTEPYKTCEIVITPVS